MIKDFEMNTRSLGNVRRDYCKKNEEQNLFMRPNVSGKEKKKEKGLQAASTDRQMRPAN